MAESLLTVKKGTQVRVKKGARVGSTHPARKGYHLAGKTYKVEVVLVHPPRFQWIGNLPEGFAHLPIAEILQNMTRPEIEWQTLQMNLTRCLGKSTLDELGTLVVEDGDLRLVHPSQVYWGGSGGYWTWTNLANVEPCDDSP